MKTITFYSYKGGVGRSLALVNVATRLAEFGKKVCLLDFDLEAPGLHLKFARNTMPKIPKGIVDYVYEFANDGHLPADIRKYCINIPVVANCPAITLIPAGNVDSSEYWKKLSTINWYELLYENENGLAFFLNLKEKIKTEIKPDFLLIDSRTGISEMSGITLSLLADDVVIVAANNRENLGGAKKIITAITNPSNSLFGKIPKITFVLSRIPFTEKPEDKTREQNLINRIRREYFGLRMQDINVIHSDRELEENERVKIAYEKDESTAQSSRDYLALFEKLTVNDLSDQEIKRFKDIRESERLFAIASSEPVATQKLDYINKAIALNDLNPDLYIFRSSIHASLEMEEEAMRDINRALKLNPNNFNAHTTYMHNLFVFNHHEAVIEKAHDLNDKFPSSPIAFLYKGASYVKLKEYVNAENAYTTLIQLDPDSPEGYAGLANTKRMQGRLDEAMQDVYKALELDSENITAVSTLAEIYAAKGDTGPFYYHLENALKIDPRAVEKFIEEDEIYKQFYDEDRFVMLLDKYDIYLESDPF